jgi:hypothetical protein
VQSGIDIDSRVFDLRPDVGEILNLSSRIDCIWQFTRGDVEGEASKDLSCPEYNWPGVVDKMQKTCICVN